MKYVLMDAVTRDRAWDISKVMADRCYEVARTMSSNSDFYRAFMILGTFVGALGNSEFCESNFTDCLRLFLAGAQGLGRNKKEARVVMRFCLDAIRASFLDNVIFRVREDSYSNSIPVLTWVDNWFAIENSTLEDL